MPRALIQITPSSRQTRDATHILCTYSLKNEAEALVKMCILRYIVILVNQIPLVSQDRIQQDARDPDRRTAGQEHFPRAAFLRLLSPNLNRQSLFLTPHSAFRIPKQCNAVG